MSQGPTFHCTAKERPSLHVFPANDPAGAVLLRIDLVRFRTPTPAGPGRDEG